MNGLRKGNLNTKKLSCSIGLMAYNEEANIGKLLESLLNQKLSNCRIEEIYVVASGCEDDTEAIALSYCKLDNRIKVIKQTKREGKASAINLFLSRAKCNIIVIESGDTIPEKDAIEKLVDPFAEASVGMTGGHPVPINSKNTFIGFIVNLQWGLHHRISLERPKMGELIAFRKLFNEIPLDTAVDEASIEAIIMQADYKLKYVEDAIVYNKGPENIRDFLKQRRRIMAGHLYVRKTQGYNVSTTSWKNILGPFIKEISWSGKGLLWTFGAIILEILGRLLGYYDFYILKINPFMWDIASSTKDLREAKNVKDKA